MYETGDNELMGCPQQHQYIAIQSVNQAMKRNRQAAASRLLSSTTPSPLPVTLRQPLQTVTVDGTTVLSKSGQFKWEWLNRLPWTRPKDDGYEVHATETGMEVRLGERTVWGITAEEWMG